MNSRSRVLQHVLRTSLRVGLTAFVGFASVSSAFAGDKPRPRLITVTWENDLFVGDDSGYTNGLGVTWARVGLAAFNKENLPSWLHAVSKRLYISSMPEKARAVSYTIAQSMQTPEDLENTELIEDEAPYFGMLAWTANLHAYDARVADTLSLTLGVVGPASGAEFSQKLSHRILGSDEPEGWEHQVDNELVFQLQAERLWRLGELSFDNGSGFDAIGIGRVALGTIRSNVVAGLSIRYGRALERSFPAATVLPGRESNPLVFGAPGSWQVFFNVLGSYVANDISADGNTFRDSHSVPLEHWQTMLVAGVSYSFGRWALLLSAVDASDNYENQPEPTRFGSLGVTVSF